MRILIVPLMILLFAIPAYAQDLSPDSTDTVFVPLDSLWAGLDLALDVAKLTRDDLTFRGDYLEPDVYRMTHFDAWMEKPTDILGCAQSRLEYEFFDFFNLMYCDPDRFVVDEPCNQINATSNVERNNGYGFVASDHSGLIGTELSNIIYSLLRRAWSTDTSRYS